MFLLRKADYTGGPEEESVSGFLRLVLIEEKESL
jgi:hypothetical protein